VVGVGRFRSWLAAVVLAGGMVAVGVLPAQAAPAAPPPPTIAAKSLFRPVTGDVFVVFGAGKFASAQIHGTIRGGTGDVATLLAQPFPFASPPVPVSSVSVTNSHQSYSFTVTPTLATRYQVRLHTGSTTVSSSATVSVYVTSFQTASGTKRCPQTHARPFCHQRVRVTEVVPASTLRDEISKHWYFYFAVNLSATRTPPAPRFARLRARVTISRPVAGGTRLFTRTLNWSFFTGTNGYSFVWVTCSKDNEAADGLGLPGHHACGVRVIDTKAEYIG